MSCNWCQDEAIARALLKELCGQDDESWKQDSDNDLCYCTPCVREYHRLKDEYTKDRPECTEVPILFIMYFNLQIAEKERFFL